MAEGIEHVGNQIREGLFEIAEAIRELKTPLSELESLSELMGLIEIDKTITGAIEKYFMNKL